MNNKNACYIGYRSKNRKCVRWPVVTHFYGISGCDIHGRNNANQLILNCVPAFVSKSAKNVKRNRAKQCRQKACLRFYGCGCLHGSGRIHEASGFNNELFITDIDRKRGIA